jgi:hypothetical protein
MSPRLLRPRASGGFRYPTLRSGLVAYWPLNESAASGDVTALDNSGRGNDLASDNTVPSTTGRQGNGRLFASANSESLGRPSTSDLQFGDGNWSLSAWGYPTSTTSKFMHLVGKDQSGGREFGLRIQTDTGTSNRPTVFIQNTDGTFLLIEPGISRTNANFVNRWWHWVITHNSGTITIYENGSPLATGLRAAGKAFAATSTPFHVGRRSFTGFLEHWDGVIDEVAKWSRALSEAEVTALYNAGSGIDLSARLGASTPAAPSFTPAAVLLTSGTSYTVPAGATSMKAWAVGSGGVGNLAGAAGGCAFKTWSVSGGTTVTYGVGAARTGGTQAGANTTVTYSGTTITGNGGGTTAGGSFSGGDGGATGGAGTSGGWGGYGQSGGAVGGNGTRAACGRLPATNVSGLFAALTLAGVSTSETCATTAAFGSGGADEKLGPTRTAGLGGGGVAAAGGLSIAGTPSGAGAVVLYFT